MLFNSYIFILFFLPITLIGYYLLNHFKIYRGALIWLIGMSLWFYGYNNPAYLVLLIASVLVNFVLGRKLEQKQSEIIRKLLFATGLVFNFGLLFYFKYYDFFISNWNRAFHTEYTLLHIMLPLGISFFTFQQLSYVIDCYKKEAPLYDFVEYAAFVTFFPQLIAGPIVLHSELIPQWKDLERRKVNYQNLTKGLYAFSLGLGKKVLLADTLSKLVNYGFEQYGSLDSANVLFAMICYSLQIYFDFSGYCDMAYGIGYLFNVELPINFNSPYKADSIGDFWDRWHMTLTRFFTHYVYISLGGNQKGTVRTYLNVLIVFIISGIWHGANWTFILWGLLNGLCVVWHRIWKKKIIRVPKIFRVAGTFLITTFAWCLFRANTIRDARNMIRVVFSGQIQKTGLNPDYAEIMNNLVEVSILQHFGFDAILQQYPAFFALLFVGVLLFAVFFMKNTQEKIKNFVPCYRKLAVFLLLMTWSVLSLSDISEFLYFNF